MLARRAQRLTNRLLTLPLEMPPFSRLTSTMSSGKTRKLLKIVGLFQLLSN